MFLLLLISQVISVMVILLSYGMIINSKRDINNATIHERGLEASFYTNIYLSDVKDDFEDLFKNVENKIRTICVDGYDDENDIAINIYMRFTYKDGQLLFDREQRDIMINQQPHHTGRYFNEEEFNHGEKVVVSGIHDKDVGDICVINGEEYKVVGHFTDGMYSFGDKIESVDMPYTAASDNMRITSICIDLTTLPTVSEYNYFATKIFDLCNYECDVYLPEKFSNETKDMYQTYMIIAAIMLGMSAINIGIVYGYILKLRKKNNAVISLCGGNKRDIVLINLVEIVLLCVVSYGVSIILFKWFIIPNLRDTFVYFEKIFEGQIYLDMFAMYIMTVIIVGTYNIIKVLRKSTSSLLKGAIR